MNTPEKTLEIPASYVEISTVTDICEPWIDLWSGDEWGEVMHSLLGACHTDYGFSDEDCALFAERLYANLLAQKEWVDAEGHVYGFWERESVEATQARAREQRDYWLKGGNLGDWNNSPEKAKGIIEQMPSWMFGE